MTMAPLIAMALIAIVAVVVVPYRYRYRISYAQPKYTPSRGFYANRLILEIKTYWR